MDFVKMPQLQALLSPHEFLHVQAFPAFLRLIYDGILEELLGMQAQGPLSGPGAKRALRGVDFKALHHNTRLVLEGEAFWEHLNFHLIHQLDFMPVQDWPRTSNVSDLFVRIFAMLHQLLRREAKLEAAVDLSRLRGVPGLVMSEGADDGQLTIEDLTRVAGADAMEKTRSTIQQHARTFSAAIGHDLSYELLWY
mmetsp:Transcript_17352/g.38950  ORF Transcript_17352/g.38950 Transcript_17352/m.38950 type:complete len:195 (-) Transcript_17352:167-751(-)